MVCWFLTVCWLFVGDGSLLVVGLLVDFLLVVFVGYGFLLVVFIGYGFLVTGGLLVFDCLLVVCW